MNTIELVILSISEQYGAGLKMLEDAIQQCPDDIWQDTTGEKIISHIAYHVLYWVDRYLCRNKDEGGNFKPFLEIKHQKDEKFIYSKQELLEYLHFDRKRANKWFNELTIDILTSDSVYDFHGTTILSSLIYDLRHIMLHVGALHVRINKFLKVPLDWESHNILYKEE